MLILASRLTQASEAERLVRVPELAHRHDLALGNRQDQDVPVAVVPGTALVHSGGAGNDQDLVAAGGEQPVP
jgi:hypothetical protein